MLQLHARSNNHETAWWILKIFEGGLWLMLIYFFSELRSGMNYPAYISKISHVTHVLTAGELRTLYKIPQKSKIFIRLPRTEPMSE